MIVIVCVDDNGGMLFNQRRQSQDRLVQQDILLHTAGARLLMNAYSYRLFQPHDAQITTIEDCLAQAGTGEFCFVENLDPVPYLDQVEGLIVYRWNRRYPADRFLSICLDPPVWKRVCCEEFAGFSHEKITKEVYRHEKNV